MGMMTELPEEWKVCKTHEKDIFYFNTSNGGICWEHPLDIINQDQIN